MQFFRTTQNVISPNNKMKRSVTGRLVATAGTLMLSIALLHSAAVMAASSSTVADQQMAQTDDSFTAKVSINRSEMTAEKKSKSPSRDNRIGAFSMEDEAREGFYGDGEYAE